MTSYLIDLVLVAALIVTSWRTGAMYRQLRRLRSENEAFGAALAEADASINKAALAVITLKSEGVETVHLLEQRTAEARAAAERLDHAIRSSDLRFALSQYEERGAAAA